MLLVTAKFHQRPQPRGLDDGGFQINPGGGIEIQRVRFGFQKPLSRRVQFLDRPGTAAGDGAANPANTGAPQQPVVNNVPF